MDFEEIVGPAGVPEKSILILTIFVAGAEPLVDERALCFLGLIPVAGAEGIALDPEVADLVGSSGAAGFIGDFRFEAGKDFAAGAGSYFAGAIGGDHVEAFGGTEGVEDFDVEALAKALEERRGEGFAGGNSVADAGKIEVGAAGAAVIEQRGVIGGNGEKEGGAIAFDVGVNAGRSRTGGRENRRGADREREVAGIAEAVGEEETGDAEAAVACVDFEDGVGIVVRADDHVVMEMYTALGNAGGTGRVEPERRVVFGGGRGGEVRRGGVH